MRARSLSVLVISLAVAGCAHEEPRVANAPAVAHGHACGGGGGSPDAHAVPAPGGPEDPMTTMMGPASPTALPPGVNAVQNEMRLLNRAMHQSLTALALGELDKIPPLFSGVHAAKGLTEHAIKSGAWKPAKGDVAAFVALDEAFHDDIVKLLQRVRARDSAGAADQLAVMTKGCIGCHEAFRAPSPAP